MKTLLALCNIIIALLLGSFAQAQDHPGIKGTGKSPRIKSINEVIAAEAFLAEPVTRRGKEKEEKAPFIRLRNPDAPAVASFGTNPGARTGAVAAGANMTVHSNFLATYIAEGPGSVPPDCNGDISTSSQVLIVVNGRLKAFNVPKLSSAALTTVQTTSTVTAATPIMNVDLDAFFLNSGMGILKVTDPHVRFDRLSNRWFVIAQDYSHTLQNYICIAVSNSAVLTGTSTFSYYYILSSTGSATASTDYFDYPTLGVDKSGLYIGGNIYTQGMVTNKGSALYVVNKDSLLSGKLVFFVWQYGVGPGLSGSDGPNTIGVLTPQGVHNDDAAATEGYFVATDWAAYSKLILKRVTWNNGVPSMSADIPLTVPTTTGPINQPALGSTGSIDAFDDRLFAAMIMKNKSTGISTLWTAHNIEVNSTGVGTSGGGRNGSRWYQISNLTTTPTLQQSGTLFDGSATKPKGFWIPSIAMNGQGHAVIGSSTAAVDRRVQVAISSRYSTDAAGSLQLYDTLTKITSAYNPSGTTPHRWGDYSQTVIDPSDNMTFWTFQEYATNANQWGLRAIQVKAPPPAATISTSASPSTYCGSAVSVTITGTGTANQGFFDPGIGYNRPSVTCTGGITASNVVVVSPTQMTCTLNTAGKAGGTYTITVANPDSQFVSTTFVLTACPYTWAGTTNNSWTTATNWTPNGIPGNTDNVVIATGALNMPVMVSGQQAANALTIQTSASLTVMDTLKIAGAISNSGTFTATNGTIILNGSAAQTVAANTFAGNLINNLRIINAAVTSSGALSIAGNLSFGNINNSTFTTSNLLTLKSNAANTATISDLTNGGVNSGNAISGQVTVERFISASGNRAYRLLGPTVNTAGGSKLYIKDNWQEGVNNLNTSSNNNPQPGFGTHISGSATGALGFDATVTGQVSLYNYNQTSTAWVPGVNTNSTNLLAKTGYLLYLRGDRGIDLHSTAATLPSSNTVLRTTGTLLTGTQTFTGLASNGNVSLVTNPYASSINWSSVSLNNTSFENYFTYWDPNMGTVGGFVTVTDAGVVSPVSNATTSIQSGQAYFVKTKAGINTPTLTIREIDKSTTNNLSVFRTASTAQKMTISLFYNDPQAGRNMADGTTALFNDNYSAGIDGNDAEEINNWGENIALVRENIHLSIEARPLITELDTLYLFMNNMKQQAYEFEVKTTQFGTNTLGQVVDKFTGRRHLISMSANTIIPFMITADAASSETDRFYIVFSNASVLPVTVTQLKAFQKGSSVQIVWTTEQEINMDKYEIERSTDGQSFINIGTVVARGNSNSILNYNFINQAPSTGNNYYRIKCLDKTGTAKYTNVAKVTIGTGLLSSLNIYPNPISGNVITLQLNLPKGYYSLTLSNKAGQQILSRSFDHLGGASSQTVDLDQKLSPGLYQLEIKSDNIKLTEQVIKK